jgi:TolB protein
MKLKHSHFLIPAGCLFGVATFLSLQPAAGAIGEFAAHGDVGNPAKSGAADYHVERQEYRISGAGKNMWFDRDEFHFVWKKLRGDFIVRTRANFVGTGVDAHRKLGWMVRSSLDANSPHLNAVVHGDGLTSLQLRRTTGGTTEEIKSTITGADVIQIERRGERYTMSVARFGQTFTTTQLEPLKLGDEVHVGLFVCSHNPEVVETAVFKYVRITIPASANLVPYRDYLGSRLETLDVYSGDRAVVYTTVDGIEAPNWTADGAALIYNSKGRLYRFSLADKQPTQIDTGFADRNNNDHVISFDGKTIGISHHAKEAGGKSVIYTLPVTGGEPKRVTDNFPSYLHGWSPDGKYLLYTGEREAEFDIYKISVNGGAEIRLTTATGLDDGSEYTPDGKYIYFNSARTGTMQIWRMKPDGSDPEQLTHDELQDWFPHVSPDGKNVLFISFAKDVPADKHPYYQQVYLRMIPLDGGDPKVVAYVYGGQGTINVPSWSPDSRRIAFVSHTGPMVSPKPATRP